MSLSRLLTCLSFPVSFFSSFLLSARSLLCPGFLSFLYPKDMWEISVSVCTLFWEERRAGECRLSFFLGRKRQEKMHPAVRMSCVKKKASKVAAIRFCDTVSGVFSKLEGGRRELIPPFPVCPPHFREVWDSPNMETFVMIKK